jgi:paraquat-inducible protein A
MAPMQSPRSLAGRHPRQAPVILLLFLVAAAALTEGLRLPAITITRAGLFDSQYSILTGLADLADNGHYAVFGLILLFSVLLPYVKLLLLAWLILSSGPVERRRRLLAWLAAVGKWSLLDVLVVSLIVFSLQGGFFVSSRLEPGLYLFAGAVILSMLLTGWIARLAARP